MAIYRCFCQTIDRRIITGARIEAENLNSVLLQARARWHNQQGFAQVEVWLGEIRLWPAAAISPEMAGDAGLGSDPAHVLPGLGVGPPRSYCPAPVVGFDWLLGRVTRATAEAPDDDQERTPVQTGGSGFVRHPQSGDGLSNSEMPQSAKPARPNAVEFPPDRDRQEAGGADRDCTEAHEFAQHLTAILTHLHAVLRLIEGEPVLNAGLEHAVNGAIAQANGAAEAVRRMRAVAF